MDVDPEPAPFALCIFHMQGQNMLAKPKCAKVPQLDMMSLQPCFDPCIGCSTMTLLPLSQTRAEAVANLLVAVNL